MQNQRIPRGSLPCNSYLHFKHPEDRDDAPPSTGGQC
jgi:hypothetical protein